MRVAIVGAGSLGSVFGGLLAEAGSEVFLLSRHHDYVDRVNNDGLVLLEDSGERVCRPRATSDSEMIGQCDLVLFMVKAYDTEAAISSASDMVGPKTIVLSLQNGLGNEELLINHFGIERVLLGRTFVGGDSVANGRIVAGIKGKRTIVGESNGELSPRALKVSELFSSAGLLCETSDNIHGVIWDKLLVNSSTGALAGVTGLSYGHLYRVPELVAAAVGVINEGISVAGALGVNLPRDDAKEIWFSGGKGQPPSFRPSILQSLDRSSKTEIDYFNGAIVRLGKQSGVPTPVNETLLACIKGLENRNRHGADPSQ